MQFIKMSEFWLFFEKGFRHILDISDYDHILFLITLSIPFAFKDWKKALILVSIFTAGQLSALLLSVFGVVAINADLLKFCVPITILLLALFTLFTAGKSSKQDGISLFGFVSLFFGIVHGLSYAPGFKSFLAVNSQSKIAPILQFTIGIQACQILVVFLVLLLSYVVQTFFRFSKRDWTLVLSAFIIGVVLPSIISNPIWYK